MRISLRSDVPIGLFLSGGVDSSALALASRLCDAEVAQSFCLGFQEISFDESAYANAVASHLGLKHDRIVLTKKDTVPLIEMICAKLDEPFGDASAIPTLMLSSFARRSVKAVLSGEGADELFGGNFWHRADHHASRTSGVLPYGEGIAFTPAQALRVCGELLRECDNIAPQPSSKSLFTATADFPSRLDLQTYLPSDLLVKMDRVPMMVSLEVRVPFLNRRLAELALRIPWHLKLNAGIGKAILKKCIQPYLPLGVTDRPKKGFSVPLDAWLWEEGPIRELIRDVLFSQKSKSRGHYDHRAIERMFSEHDRFQIMHGYRIWLLFMFEMWCRNFIDKPPIRYAATA